MFPADLLFVDILDKLIRMDVVAKKLLLTMKMMSHGRKLPHSSTSVSIRGILSCTSYIVILLIFLPQLSFFIMFPAKRHITLVRSKENLRAFPNDFSVCVSRIALRPSSAPADRWDFLDDVSDFHQSSRTWKQMCLEVRTQTVAENRNPIKIHDVRKRINFLRERNCASSIRTASTFFP